MKILLLNQTFYPDSVATAQQLTDLALYLTEKGHEVSVVTARRGYDKRDQIHAKFENYRGIKIHRVGGTGLGKLSFFRRIVDALTFDIMLVWKLLWTRRQDLVVSYTSPPLIGFLGTIFCLLKGGRSAQWLMDINPDAAIAVGYINERSLPGRFLLWALDFTLKYSQHVVVLDRWMKKKAMAHRASESKIVIVPPWPAHGVEEVAQTVANGNVFRELHGLQDKFVVLYSGNHSIVHPLETLLQAAKNLSDDPSVLFLFIGGGLRVQEVTAFKQQHKLPNILQLPHQPREMLSQSLSSANLHVVVMGNAVAGLVHTSKIYGILATGTPYVVIGPKQSHLGDLIAECPGGFLVEHGSVDELVAVIRSAQQLSGSRLQEIGKLNRGYILNRCGAKSSLDVFLKEVVENVNAPLSPSSDSKQESLRPNLPSHSERTGRTSAN